MGTARAYVAREGREGNDMNYTVDRVYIWGEIKPGQEKN